MLSCSVTVDVPDLAEGLRFYRKAFGFEEVASPFPGYAVLRQGDASLSLFEKAEGSSPSPFTGDRRHYDRHWTPVHLDFHVREFPEALARVLAAGAKQEHLFPATDGRPAVAFCSDPFGHGFCLIGERR